MATAGQPEKVSTRERFKQMGQVVAFTAKGDKTFVPLAVGVALIPLIALALILVFTTFTIFSLVWVLAMVMLAFVGFMVVLRNRSNHVFMNQAEETPGAAAQVIQNIPRGDYRVTPAYASTTQFDMIHLVLSRKGVILVAEGPNPQRIRQMLGQEKRRLAKVIGSAEMKDILVGYGEGEVPLRKLQSTLVRMPNVISPKDVNALDTRLKALTARPQMPKGAIPKNMRPQNMPRGGRPR